MGTSRSQTVVQAHHNEQTEPPWQLAGLVRQPSCRAAHDHGSLAARGAVAAWRLAHDRAGASPCSTASPATEPPAALPATQTAGGPSTATDDAVHVPNVLARRRAQLAVRVLPRARLQTRGHDAIHVRDQTLLPPGRGCL